MAARRSLAADPPIEKGRQYHCRPLLIMPLYGLAGLELAKGSWWLALQHHFHRATFGCFGPLSAVSGHKQSSYRAYGVIDCLGHGTHVRGIWGSSPP